MEKDFDMWNVKKKKLHNTEYLDKKFKEGEIWWCGAGLNIGHEIDGKHNTFERPFYILKKCSDTMFVGIPCTSNFKRGLYMYHLLTNELDFILNFSQIKTLSSKRLLRKVVHTPDPIQEEILNKFIGYIKRKPSV